MKRRIWVDGYYPGMRVEAKVHSLDSTGRSHWDWLDATVLRIAKGTIDGWVYVKVAAMGWDEKGLKQEYLRPVDPLFLLNTYNPEAVEAWLNSETA